MDLLGRIPLQCGIQGMRRRRVVRRQRVELNHVVFSAHAHHRLLAHRCEAVGLLLWLDNPCHLHNWRAASRVGKSRSRPACTERTGLISAQEQDAELAIQSLRDSRQWKSLAALCGSHEPVLIGRCEFNAKKTDKGPSLPDLRLLTLV